jgi:hypothetical protein
MALPQNNSAVTKSIINSDTINVAKKEFRLTYKPEILTSGFIDIINNGQVNASARFIRLMVGELGKFALPYVLMWLLKSCKTERSSSATAMRIRSLMAGIWQV